MRDINSQFMGHRHYDEIGTVDAHRYSQFMGLRHDNETNDSRGSMKFYYFCEALLDQGHYIGDDPIGHACTNKAEFVFNDVAICKSCKELLESQSPRITLPTFTTTLEERVAHWKSCISTMVDDAREKFNCMWQEIVDKL